MNRFLITNTLWILSDAYRVLLHIQKLMNKLLVSDIQLIPVKTSKQVNNEHCLGCYDF